MTFKKLIIGFVVFILLIAAIAGALFSIYVYPFMKDMKTTTTIPYDKQLTIILGGGGNTGILVSDSAVLVIDDKMDAAADSLAKTVKALAGNKPIIVVNTHIHTDHTSGNKYYKGQTIIAGANYGRDFWIKECGDDALPTIWLKDSMTFHIGDETVTVVNLPWPAHTQSDVFVYLRNRKMLFGGDVILNRQSPVIFSRYKGDPEGYLRAFDWLEQRFDIKQVVPGHGPVGGVEVIDNFRTFFNDMKTASMDPSKEKELLAKYKDWGQIPIVMSPGAIEKSFKK